jgi:hypothetical protein
LRKPLLWTGFKQPFINGTDHLALLIAGAHFILLCSVSDTRISYRQQELFVREFFFGGLGSSAGVARRHSQGIPPRRTLPGHQPDRTPQDSGTLTGNKRFLRAIPLEPEGGALLGRIPADILRNAGPAANRPGPVPGSPSANGGGMYAALVCNDIARSTATQQNDRTASVAEVRIGGTAGFIQQLPLGFLG